MVKMEFMILKNYPTERSYFIKKPLHTSIFASIKDLMVGSNKKSES